MAIFIALIVPRHFRSSSNHSFCRYGAHRMFTMSKRERTFHLLTYLTQGSSYLNPRAYAILHRHHAYTDGPRTPLSREPPRLYVDDVGNPANTTTTLIDAPAQNQSSKADIPSGLS